MTNTIHIVNGPNLNLLGQREPEVYGHLSFDEYSLGLKEKFAGTTIRTFQSNHEGEIIDYLQQAVGRQGHLVINAGALSHYSLAIADAISALEIRAVEVHISNVYARESFRHQSVLASRCIGQISGLGPDGYTFAVAFLQSRSG